MLRKRMLLGFCLLLGICSSSLSIAAAVASGKINGMTLSTPRGSAEWADDEIVPTIADLRSLGVNWIAIHPYARIQRDGTVRWRRRGDSREAPAWLRRPIEEAHRQGVKILIKPHLAHWGNYSWRGEIEYHSEQEWSRFFDTYGAWVRELARYSEGADAFAVGTELDRTLTREAAWREVIATVREEFSGALTYAANWTDYERVPFWDALDAIGIQAYFPLLPTDAVTPGQLPSPEALDAAWDRIMARVRAFGERLDKTVVFTELGYNNSWSAATEPWDYSMRGGNDAEALQRLCMEAALRAIAREPAVVGAFLWKWFPGDRIPRDFAMSSPAMRQVISSYWASCPGR